MSRFLDRFLPPTERRTALWLALGGAMVGWIAGRVGGLALEQMRSIVLEDPMPTRSAYVVTALVEFAAVALVIAALIRFARAPKVLALYVALGAALDIALGIIGLPAAFLGTRSVAAAGFAPGPGLVATGSDFWASSAAAVLAHLGVGLGALAGAWIAATVSLARIRDTGFSGDEPNGKGLRSKPAGTGWSFVGWEGQPLAGGARLALAFVAAAAVVGLVAAALGLVALLIPGRFDGGLAANGIGVVFAILLVASWLLAARAVTLRSGVVSLWLVPLSAGFGSMVFVVESVTMLGLTGPADALSISAVNLLVPLLATLAALVGVELAIRREPATLRSNAQDSDADGASADTAGGTDG